MRACEGSNAKGLDAREMLKTGKNILSAAVMGKSRPVLRELQLGAALEEARANRRGE